MERKVFTKAEIDYLFFGLDKVGCYGTDNGGTAYKCPYWDWELKDEESRQGDCNIKQSQKLCVLLKVAESGELLLVLRDKTSTDMVRETEEKEETIQKRIDSLEQDIIEKQQALEEAERQKNKVKSKLLNQG